MADGHSRVRVRVHNNPLSALLACRLQVHDAVGKHNLLQVTKSLDVPSARLLNLMFVAVINIGH